ncbi:hypothetical protein LSTR_LSTR017430, partial [Laodelphax striatellus]
MQCLVVIVGALAVAAALAEGLAVLPHDTYPGFTVKKFPGDHVMNYRLLETGFSQFFTVLDDGLVMTTSDLSPLVNRPVNLVVLEESPNSTSTHTLQLYVLDRRDMLRFPEELYEDAHVIENAAKATKVTGLPVLLAIGEGAGGSSLKYTIISGNEDHAFALQEEKTRNGTGVRLVTAKTLDREQKPSYELKVQASDSRGIDKAITSVKVEVEDENDNSPVFAQNVYRFTISDLKSGSGLGNKTETVRFSSVGKVSAVDADGDKVAYRLAVPSNLVVIVPQTGEILLTGDPPVVPGEDTEVELAVEAHDLRTPSRTSQPAQVWLQFAAPMPDDDSDDALQHLATPHRVFKRRVTRAVRPTKRTDFTEGDGEVEGKIVFQLEKETERETFKIRDENPWVTVEPNGAVRVKKKWDYEELGPEKTIDFWVTITNAGVGG